MRKTRHWRKNYPYYKVQFFDAISRSWRDKQGAHDTVEAARAYIARMAGSEAVRIMVVEQNHRYPLNS